MRQRWQRDRILGLAGVALLALVLGLLSASGAAEGLERRALDQAGRVRHRLLGPDPVDPRLVLVEVDEATLRRQGKPLALWAEDFALVLGALREAGAAAVGLDFILAADVSGLSPADPVRQRLEDGEAALAATLMDGGIVIAEVRGEKPARSSDPIHFAAAALGNAAAINVRTDPDGVVRTVPLLASREVAEAGSFFGRVCEVSLGSRPPIPTEDGDMRIAFPGRAFPTVSFADLLDRVHRRDALGEFRGRICLVGPGGEEFGDLVATPYEGSVPGLQVNAAAVNTVLTGAFLRRAPAWAWGMLTFVPALLAGLAALDLRPRFSLLALAVLAGGLGAAAVAGLEAGGWFPLAIPLVAICATFTAGYLARYVATERAHREVRGLFGRFVSRQVLEDLFHHPELLEMKGKRRQVTVLFSDINDFSVICSRNTPEAVVSMLNAYYEPMVETVFRHGGTVRQFVGDEIMAMFGAPVPVDDGPERAVRAALEMVDRLQAMRESAPPGAEGFFETKIGIHTGDVVVGTVGSVARSEYTAVGQDVNIGARLEALTKQLGATILASGEVYEAARHLPGVEWIPHGRHLMKGIGREVEVYEVRRGGSSG